MDETTGDHWAQEEPFGEASQTNSGSLRFRWPTLAQSKTSGAVQRRSAASASFPSRALPARGPEPVTQHDIHAIISGPNGMSRQQNSDRCLIHAPFASHGGNVFSRCTKASSISFKADTRRAISAAAIAKIFILNFASSALVFFGCVICSAHHRARVPDAHTLISASNKFRPQIMPIDEGGASHPIVDRWWRCSVAHWIAFDVDAEFGHPPFSAEHLLSRLVARPAATAHPRARIAAAHESVLCSSASSEPTSKSTLARAANTPACVVRPTCNGWSWAPKLAPRRGIFEIAITCRGLTAFSRLRRARGTSLGCPRIAVGWLSHDQLRRPGSTLLDQGPNFTVLPRCKRQAHRDPLRPSGFGQDVSQILPTITRMAIHADASSWSVHVGSRAIDQRASRSRGFPEDFGVRHRWP